MLGRIFVWTLVWALAVCPVEAQSPQVRATVLFGVGKPAAAAAYSGPGDVVSGAFAWWGLRAYNLAKAGTKAVRLVRASDSAQQDINSLANGSLDVSSASTFCNATSCKVAKLYDQSGNTNCTGSVACDLTQGTDASRPAFTLNCIGSLPCMTFAGAQTITSLGVTAAQSQPYSLSFVCERTGNTSSFQVCVADEATDFQSGFTNSVNTAFMYAGSVQSVAGVADSSFHAFQHIYNGASSVLYVDGGSNSTSAGTGGILITTGFDFGSTAGSNPLTGLMTEGGIWISALNGTQQSNLNSNQHTYWGF